MDFQTGSYLIFGKIPAHFEQMQNGESSKVVVTDAQVAEYVGRLREGGPLGKVFPRPMSECEFTKEQRLMIREARAVRKAKLKDAKGLAASLETNAAGAAPLNPGAVPPKIEKMKASSKLGRMLYLQSGRCFFCGEPLKPEEASIEHLNPRSRGGANSEDNQVVCHWTLNQAFGSLDLKSKFGFVLRAAGSFKCPKK